MKIRLQLFTVLLLLLIPMSLHSQTQKIDMLLNEFITKSEKIVLLQSLTEHITEKPQSKLHNPGNTAESNRIDSVIFSLADGTKYKESYAYDNNLWSNYLTGVLIEGEWNNYERVTVDRNENGKNIFQLTENWDVSEWTPALRSTREFDSNGNNTWQLKEEWNSEQTKWDTVETTQSEYDANGNILSIEGFIYNNALNFFAKIEGTMQYDENGRLITQVMAMYMNDFLFIKQRLTATYDANGNKASELLEDWKNDQWMYAFLYTYEFDTNANMIFEIDKNWDEDLSIWKNLRRHIVEYSAHYNQTMNLSETWNEIDSLWQGSSRYSYEYNSDDKLTLKLLEKTDSTLQWVNNYQYKYVFNEECILTAGSYEEWIENNWAPADGHLEFDDPGGSDDYFYFDAHLIEGVFYSKVTGIEDEENIVKVFTLSQNYPNPFNPTTSIEYQVSRRENVTLKVYDILGNEIATLVNEQKAPGTYEIKFNASNLSSGVYFYRLQTASGFNAIRKSILLK